MKLTQHTKEKITEHQGVSPVNEKAIVDAYLVNF